MAKRKIRIKAMEDENPEMQPPAEEAPPPPAPADEPVDEPAPDPPPADPEPDEPDAPAPPRAPMDDRILLLAAIIYTKPGPGSLADAYRHAKNLIQMLEDTD